MSKRDPDTSSTYLISQNIVFAIRIRLVLSICRVLIKKLSVEIAVKRYIETILFQMICGVRKVQTGQVKVATTFLKQVKASVKLVLTISEEVKNKTRPF